MTTDTFPMGWSEPHKSRVMAIVGSPPLSFRVCIERQLSAGAWPVDAVELDVADKTLRVFHSLN